MQEDIENKSLTLIINTNCQRRTGEHQATQPGAFLYPSRRMIIYYGWPNERRFDHGRSKHYRDCQPEGRYR